MPIPGVLSHTLGRMVFNIIPGTFPLCVRYVLSTLSGVRGDPVLNPTFYQGLGTELGTSEFSLVCTYEYVHLSGVRGDPVLNPTFYQGLGTELGTSEFSLVCTYKYVHLSGVRGDPVKVWELNQCPRTDRGGITALPPPPFDDDEVHAVIQCAVNPLPWEEVEEKFIAKFELCSTVGKEYIVPLSSLSHPICVVPDYGSPLSNMYMLILPKGQWSEYFARQVNKLI